METEKSETTTTSEYAAPLVTTSSHLEGSPTAPPSPATDTLSKPASKDVPESTRLVAHSGTGRGKKEPSKDLDGGWAWVILAGSFYIAGSIINLTPLFGILFSQKMVTMGLSSTTISWLFTLHGTLWNFGILITNAIVSKFGYRNTAFFGCLFVSIAFILLAFSTSVIHILVLYSIIIPICAGPASIVSFLILPLYFERYRGLAMAILMTGISVGGIICPLVIRALQDEYGFLGATLIHGAILLNCCVAAALYRSPPIKQNKSNTQNDDKEMVFCEKRDKNIATDIEKLEKNDKRNNRYISKVWFRPLRDWFVNIYLVLRDKRVLLTGLSLSTAMVGYFNFLVMVPFALESTGHSSQFSAMCVSVSYFSNCGSRLAMSFLADRKWFRRRIVFILGIFLASVFSFSFGFLSFPESVLTTMIFIYGAGMGIYLSLFHINLIDVLGMTLYAQAIGVNSAVMALTYSTVGFLIGVIRNSSDSYTPSLAACAALHLIAGLLWFGVRGNDTKPTSINCSSTTNNNVEA